jgi:hypothetical protein
MRLKRRKDKLLGWGEKMANGLRNPSSLWKGSCQGREKRDGHMIDTIIFGKSIISPQS